GTLGFGRAVIEQIGEVGVIGIAKPRHADADQAELRTVGLACEQIAASSEDLDGKLRRVGERQRPRADTEIGGLEVERYCRAGKLPSLETGGHLPGRPPQSLFERSDLGDILLKRLLRRDALGLALGPDRPVVDPVREPVEPRAFGTVAAGEFGLAAAL